MSSVSGMAASIRAATESETFDLAGNSPSTITTTIQSAFCSPFPLSSMIRITFITGAGKLGRQKYDDSAAKTVSSTLRDLGFVEDRGASCVNECAGMFKSQHDTGKNLKTIVVFPMITSGGDGVDGLDVDGSMSLGQSLLEDGSPKEMIAMSSMNVFERMIANKCHSWSQKKTCLGILTELKDMLNSLDSKLLNGTLLTDPEQEFYDAISMDTLEVKTTFVKDEMKNYVDEGRITKLETQKLVQQVNDKINTVDEEIAKAKKENKPKKMDKLSTQKEKMMERRETLQNITPIAPSPLKFQAQIQKLRKEMQPLLKLEKETKGRLLSIKETTMMSRKEEIEDEILEFEEKSRGWFEEDEDFNLRVGASRAKAATATKKVAKKTASSGKAGAKKPITNWVVPGAAKKRATKKPTKKTSTSNAFAAMMMDSDSDSD